MRKIAFVEPLFYGVNLLKKARVMGFEIIVIISDANNPIVNHYEGLFDNYIIANTQDYKSIIESLKRSNYVESIDAIIPAADYVTEVTAKVAKILGFRGVNETAAKAARDKGLAKELYEQKGVSSAKYAIVTGEESAIANARKIGYPVVLKPQNACGSQNVFFISNEDELIEKIADIRQFKYSYLNYKIKDSYLLEEFIDGPEFSVELYIDESRVKFAEVTEKVVSELPYFVEKMHVLPSSIMKDRKQQIIKAASEAVLALGFDGGVFHVEIKACNNGEKIIEVNGRPGGDNITSDLLINAKNVDLYTALIKWYLKEDVVFDNQIEKASAIAYIMPDKKGIVKGIDNIEQIEKMTEVTRIGFDLDLPCKVDIAHDSDGRIGYVIFTDDDSKKVKQKAEETIKKIKLIYSATSEEVS